MGTLFAFVDPNGIEYRAKFSDGIFHGYYSSVNGYFSDTITVSSDDNSYSVLLPGYNMGQPMIMRYKFYTQISRFGIGGDKIMPSTRSEDLQTLGLFGSANPAVYSMAFNLNNDVFSGEQMDFSNFEFWIINDNLQFGHSAQPEIFVLVKIAEMAKRHETYFYDFTIHFNNWTNEMNGGVWDEQYFDQYKGTFLQEGNRIEHNPFLYDFYCDFLREFMDYVDYRQELTAQCLDFAFDLFSMDLLTTLSETGFFNNLNNVMFTLDQSSQFRQCIGGLSQDEMYELSDTNRNNAIAILLWNENNGYNQIVNLIKYSNNQKFHFYQTWDLVVEFGSGTRLIEFLSACPIELLAYIGINARIAVLDAVVKDDSKWYNTDYKSNLLNNLILSTPKSNQIQLLSEFRTSIWFAKIQEQMSEWTDATDIMDLQTVQMAFSSLALMVIENYSALNIGTAHHSILYSSTHYPNSGYLTSNGASPYLIEFTFADFPILVGNTGVSDSWSLGSNDGLHQNYFVYPNQESIPFEFSGGTLNVTQNYRLRESIMPPTPAIISGDPYNFNNYQYNFSPVEYDVFHINNSYSLHPYELVEFVFVENHNTAGYQKGDRMLLPAFYGICLAQSLENEDFQIAMEWVEPVVMAAAAALAPESAGASLLLAAAIFQTVDAVINEYKVSVDPSFVNSSFVQIWDTFDDVITLIDLAGGLTMVPKLFNGLYKIGQFGLAKGWKLVESIVIRRLVNLPYLAENFSTPYHKFFTMKLSEAFRTGMTYNQILNFYQALGAGLKANVLSRLSDDLSALKSWISSLDESNHIDVLIKLDDLFSKSKYDCSFDKTE
ncbi:MAG: hypothetical protein IPM74_03990 [Crocinitomicaceae bacterium]|nr:hypothetical protein [Crocinitomicaceae bacterium]